MKLFTFILLLFSYSLWGNDNFLNRPTKNGKITEIVNFITQDMNGYPQCDSPSQRYKMVVALLDSEVKPRDIQMRTIALFRALENFDEQRALLLVKKGVNVNARNEKGQAPLHLALQLLFSETAALLIKKGASVKTMDENGNTPLHVDTMWPNQKLMSLLLIQEGADINAKNKYGETPLHNMIVFGRTEIAKLLIEKGADVNAKNNHSETPLFGAIITNQIGMTKLLIENGANIKSRDKNRWTALHWATWGNKKKEIISLLVKKGADVNAKNKYGNTPLQLVLPFRKRKKIALLLKKGADVNAKNKYGNTPLQLVLPFRKRKKIALLLKKGADQEDENDHDEIQKSDSNTSLLFSH